MSAVCRAVCERSREEGPERSRWGWSLGDPRILVGCCSPCCPAEHTQLISCCFLQALLPELPSSKCQQFLRGSPESLFCFVFSNYLETVTSPVTSVPVYLENILKIWLHTACFPVGTEPWPPFLWGCDPRFVSPSLW